MNWVQEIFYQVGMTLKSDSLFYPAVGMIIVAFVVTTIGGMIVERHNKKRNKKGPSA